MSEFEIDPKDIDYEALPPLVGPGEKRDEVINTLVDAWCTDLITGWPQEHTSQNAFSEHDETRVVHGVVLDRVKLQDSLGDPIDLIDLLNRVADTLRTRHPDIPAGGLRQCRVVLRACSIPSCQGTQGKPLNLPCDFVSVACKFAAGVNFDSAAFAGDAWFDSAAFAGSAGFHSAAFAGEAWFDSAAFAGSAGFRSAAFAGDAWFDSAAFAGSAGFHSAAFAWDAWFDSAAFAGSAGVRSAAFAGDAWFDSAAFAGSAGFHSAAFAGDAWFDSAAFAGSAGFDSAAFAGSAGFRSAAFAGDAGFRSAAFAGSAGFDSAAFAGNTDFRSAAFAGSAGFDSAAFAGTFRAGGGTFAKPPRFHNAWFSEHQFDVSSSIQAATFYSDSSDSARFGRSPPARGRRRLWWLLWARGRCHSLDWGLVRGVGELAILTRASMLALVLVPILAGLWPALRSAVQRYSDVHWKQGVAPRVVDWMVGSLDHTPHVVSTPAQSFLNSHMPGSFALLFFAALLVVIGRSIYQANVPQLVRERSRFDLIRDRLDEFRQAKDDERSRWLQEAISFIEEAGKDERLAWFRHPSLVNHHGRTYWVPSRVEDFEDYRPEQRDLAAEAKAEVDRRLSERLARVRELKGEAAPATKDAATEIAPASSPGSAASPVAPSKPTTAGPTIPRATRESIAIRAGADAQYDRVARENISAAHLSLWCYTLAGSLVAWLVIEQAASVLIEVQFDGLAWWLLFLGVLACVGSLLWMWWRVVRESWLKRGGLARPAHLSKDHWKVVSEFEYDLESRIAEARRRLARAAGVSRSEPGGGPT
ncbi:MAG: pentapeptide repeat-containing protein [Phycisphaerales bacterium]